MTADWEKEISTYLYQRKQEDTFRVLSLPTEGIDFCSNDYLGLSKSAWIAQRVSDYHRKYKYAPQGATGSRLLSGQSKHIIAIEEQIADFHHAESALLFSSGYMANIGIISTLARKDHIIFYDNSIHASLHQGIRLSGAKSYSFGHNLLDELEILAQQHIAKIRFVVVESLYSMDGDMIEKERFLHICNQYNLIPIVDEAHAVGIYGHKGQGIFYTEEVGVRIVTYGKALGHHGAAVLSSRLTREYLINFCKTFIYTTALPIHEILRLKASYDYLYLYDNQKNKLLYLINYFNSKKHLTLNKIIGDGPIFGYIVGNSSDAKILTKKLQDNGLYIKPIVYPTVDKGLERLRINLHSYNTRADIDFLIEKIIQWETQDIS